MTRFLPIGLLLLCTCLTAADSNPTLISFDPSPDYSELGRKAGVKGSVRLQVVVGADGGSPKKIDVTSSLGWGLDEEAIKAVSKWQFRAAQLKGSPVEATAQVECQFSGPTAGSLHFGAMTFDLPAAAAKPVLTSFVPPHFPQELSASHETGQVSFTVSEQGAPENIHVEQSSSSALEIAVVDALRQWQFQPALQDGKPISAHASLTFESATAK